MTLSTNTAALASQAGRGNLTALELLLRDLATQLGELAAADLSLLAAITATAAEINDLDLSARTQEISEAGAIDLDARHVEITGPAEGTYAVTLAAPTRAGIVKVIEMVATTSTNAVTLALTNVSGGSAATSASFNAAGETLVLVSASDHWIVLGEAGVTLS